MSSLELNALNINGFVLEIARIPILKYTVQEIQFPGVSLSPVEQSNPFLKIQQVGDHLSYDELSFTFMVDEKMMNYRCIYQWMKGLGFPDDYTDYAKFIKGITGDENLEAVTNNDRLNQFSDVTITLLTNHKNPQLVYRLKDAFPTNLSGFSAQVTNSESTPVTANCTMQFTTMEISPA